MIKKGRNIAFVVQRFGLEINGGAESHCRQLAEKLNVNNNVEILTTCSFDYNTWDHHYDEGISNINGLKVCRFKNFCVKDKRKEKFYRKMFYGKWKLLKDLKFRRLFMSLIKAETVGDNWISAAGPFCEELINYLSAHHQKYDVIIFMTYLYYPTVFGLRVAPEKSMLIPTAHDEEFIYFPPFKNVFNSPAFIMYNMEVERSFVNRVFNNEHIPSDVAGVGIELMIDQPLTIPLTDDIPKNYILYVGRVDEAKGVVELFELFINYKKNYQSDLALVIVGQAFVEIPKREDILYLGFVSDDVRNNLMRNALMFVLPSKFESLSMVVLESLYLKVPVLVNGKCEVLVEHCVKSKAGFYFNNQEDFIKYLNKGIENPLLLNKMGELGRLYVENNYSWDIVLSKFEKAFIEIEKLRQDSIN